MDSLNRHPRLIRVVFFALLVLITFANTFTHGYNLDDFLVRDALPPDGASWGETFGVFTKAYNFIDYRPISVFTFAVEKKLQGELVPATAHVMNAVYYLICALILFACLRRLPVREAELLALAGTAIFIVHPIHSNVVSSLKNRDIILSLALGLTALYLVLRFIQYEHVNRYRQAVIRGLLLTGAFLVFQVATTAKLDSVSFVILLPVTFFIFSKNRRWLLYGVGGAAFGYAAYQAFRYFRLRVITPRFLEEVTTEESILITENAMVLQDGLLAKVQAGLITLFYYIKFHIVPTGYYYYFGYDMIPVDELFLWQNIVAFAVALISLAAFIWFFRRRPEISWGIAFFYGGLMYCLNLYTPIAGIVAPRLAFIASVGFCFLLAILLVDAGRLAANRIKTPRWDYRRWSFVLLAVVLVFYIPFTMHRNKAWKDIITLIETDIGHLDRSFEGQRIACMNYLEASKWVQTDDQAVDYLRKTLRHCEQASDIYGENQFVEETIGLANYILKDYNAAFSQFNHVIEVFDTSEMAFEYMGDIMRFSGNPAEAAAYYTRLVEIAPDYHMAYFKFTQAAQESGLVEAGIEQHKAFARTWPEYPFAWEGLGFLYLQQRDTVTATHCFFTALDKGSQNRQYVEAMEPYYRRRDMKEAWMALLSGERMNILAPANP